MTELSASENTTQKIPNHNKTEARQLFWLAYEVNKKVKSQDKQSSSPCSYSWLWAYYLLSRYFTFKQAACHERSGETLRMNWSWINPPQPTQVLTHSPEIKLKYSTGNINSPFNFEVK